MKVTFHIEGLTELAAALENEFSKATATNIQKRALMTAAEPIESTAKLLAPYKTGKLKEKIDIGTKLSPRQKSINNKESKVEVYVGPPSMPRAIVSEFGSYKETPRAFMRPAWDQNKRTAFEKIRDILAEEIEKARERAARKTARFMTKRS